MNATPRWFCDAKLGIFIHWGIFSVPAFGPRGRSIVDILRSYPDDGVARSPYAEWYENSIRFPQSPAAAHHRATYGARTYRSFRDDFDAASQAFDADAWAELFAAAGAKYAVFVTKHHDGYCLWPTGVANPYRPGWHSTRDFVGELAAATRARDLTFGTYYSGGLDWTFRDTPIGSFGGMMAAVPFEDPYRAYAAAQYRELIARYDTAVLWNDIAYPDEADRDALIADFRAARPDGIVNNRWMASRSFLEKMRIPAGRAALDARIAARWNSGEGNPMQDSGLGDFHTPEYADELEFGDRPWEACRGLDLSFGYNAGAQPEDHLTPTDLIRSFADIVAHGGNLLLNVGPRADGSIPDIQQSLLRTLGTWLKTNGAAIYGARRLATPSGTASDGTPYRVTQTEGALHVLFMATPRATTLTLPTLTAAMAAKRPDGGNVTLQAADPVTMTLGAPFDDAPVHVVTLEGAALRNV